MTQLPAFKDIVAASKVLDGHAVRTPLIESQILNDLTGGRIFLKAECLQRTGSFKFRGAFNALSNIPNESLEKGVLACSSGNHAQGVAESARLKGCSATIIMPADAPETKKNRTKRSGATVVEYDRYKEDREAILQKMADETGSVAVHPYENFHVIAGQGTAGLEAAEELQSLELSCDRALVCAGGGGLTSGVALALRHHFPDVSVHTVEPEGYDDQRASLEAGKQVGQNTNQPSVCDAILTPQPGDLAFAICKDILAEGLVVTDSEALRAVAFAFNELKLVVEPGGAAALAALLAGKVDVSNEIVVATLSGGNIDADILELALNEHSQ